MAIVTNMESLTEFEIEIDGECWVTPKDTRESAFREAGQKILAERAQKKKQE